MLLGDRDIKGCHGALWAKSAFQEIAIAKAIPNLCLKRFSWVRAKPDRKKFTLSETGFLVGSSTIAPV
jgi:hypothetical protein